MKVLLNLSFLLFLVMGLSFSSCKNQPKGVDTNVGEASNTPATASAADTKYTITDGQINWTGTKVGGQHMGTLDVAGGEIAANNGNVTSGYVNLDMNSIEVTDIGEDDGKSKLEGHLKSDDFFGVGAHPTGKFVITNVRNTGSGVSVTGDLTLKGITKSITFPANVVSTSDKISVVSPSFKINRTEWDIKYGSGLINTAKDKIIHDDISLVLNVEGKAK